MVLFLKHIGRIVSSGLIIVLGKYVNRYDTKHNVIKIDYGKNIHSKLTVQPRGLRKQY